METMRESGIFGLYTLEKHRLELHNAICEKMKIDKVKSKEILPYLDEKIGLDFNKELSNSDIKIYAKKLIKLLNIEREKENLT